MHVDLLLRRDADIITMDERRHQPRPGRADGPAWASRTAWVAGTEVVATFADDRCTHGEAAVMPAA